MEFNIFKISDDRNKVFKEKEEKVSFQILLKRAINIQTPEIIIQSDQDFTDYNYAEIPYFERYYFINEIVPYPNNTYKFSLEVDVLESFGTEIIENTEFVQNNQSVFVDIDTVYSNVTLEEDVSFILTTLGVDY